MKRTTIAACAVVILLAACYFASPFLGYYRLQAAARSGDQDALEASVDFPAVRENLKAQLNIALGRKMQSDPQLKNNPFAGLGMMFATALVGKLVDSYLTPEAISMMISKAKAPSPGERPMVPGSKANIKLATGYAYIDIDRFRVTAADPSRADKPLGFVMERRGLFSWKLIRIELPAALFD
jgi:hypothetical protein